MTIAAAQAVAGEAGKTGGIPGPARRTCRPAHRSRGVPTSDRAGGASARSSVISTPIRGGELAARAPGTPIRSPSPPTSEAFR